MMKWTFGLVFLLSNFLFSQNLDYNNGYESVRICTAIQGNNFVSEKSADEALTKILSVIGASKRFVLQECSNINNAVALTFNGVRYIMYDPEFMSELKYSSDWTNMFILAHEVGHHINGHSVDVILSSNGMGEETSLSTKRTQELEADEFAGFVLGRLGATLSQTQSVMKTISSDGDDSYSTHPSRSKRLNAIKKGFENSGGYVDSSNLDIKKGKTVDSPYSNSRYTGVKYQTRNDLFSDGLYKGYISVNKDKPFGYGTFFGNNGLIYEGEWVDGKRNGYGKLTYPSGGIYEGFFVNNRRSGEGVEIYPNGDKVVGFYSDNKFLRGTISYNNGIILEGLFNGTDKIVRVKQTTDGKEINLGFLDGSKGNGNTTYTEENYTIKGNFIDGDLKPYPGQIIGSTESIGRYNPRYSVPKYLKKIHKKKQICWINDFIPYYIIIDSGTNFEFSSETNFSFGEKFFSDGVHYIGSFLHGTFEFYGYGEMTFGRNNYKGMFWNDMFNGYGILTKSDGTVQKGLFRNGEFIKNEDFDFEWMSKMKFNYDYEWMSYIK